jgi:molybdopterin molybdotransferase
MAELVHIKVFLKCLQMLYLATIIQNKKMIEADEALELVLGHSADPGLESVPLELSVGRVLREDLVADADFPPFDRVMMDGVAIAFHALEKGIRDFEIEQVQGAGEPQTTLQKESGCIEIMTGAIRPAGADIVIPYEDLRIADGKVYIEEGLSGVRRWKNIHRRGTDVQEGRVLVTAGCRLGVAEVGVAASIGKTTVKVTRSLRIAIISSGNELIDIDRKPLPHQIRKSNVYAIRAALGSHGSGARVYHLEDDPESMKKVLAAVLEDNDVLLISGGVSRGKYDYVPDILCSLGVEKILHKVNQKPGKPFWFGVSGRSTVFAFPGNPVSALVCYYKYFMPWLDISLGLKDRHQPHAVLGGDCANSTGKTLFVPAIVQTDNQGRMVAVPHVGGGSGDHANLLSCNAFVELDRRITHADAGQAVPVLFFNDYH